MDSLKKQDGYQLIEITLSIALLSIILLSFFGFFIQSKHFNAHNEKELTAEQLSQEVLQKVKSSDYHDTLTNIQLKTLYPDGEIIDGALQIQVGNKSYGIVVQIRPASNTANLPDNLNVIEVGVQDPNGKTLYKTYGYKEKGTS